MSTTTPTPTTTGPAATYPSLRAAWVPLAALCLAFFVEMVDNTLLTIALPTIGRDLGSGTTALQWVTGAYSVVFGGLIAQFVSWRVTFGVMILCGNGLEHFELRGGGGDDKLTGSAGDDELDVDVVRILQRQDHHAGVLEPRDLAVLDAGLVQARDGGAQLLLGAHLQAQVVEPDADDGDPLVLEGRDQHVVVVLDPWTPLDAAALRALADAGNRGLAIESGPAVAPLAWPPPATGDDLLGELAAAAGAAVVDSRPMPAWAIRRAAFVDEMLLAFALKSASNHSTLSELLRSEYAEILPGFYMDKRCWISVLLDGGVSDELLRDLCRKSHALVFEKLTKKAQREILQG